MLSYQIDCFVCRSKILKKIPKTLLKKDESKKLKPFWKDIIGQEERLIDREKLKKLESRTRFLPNPRLDAARIAKMYFFVEFLLRF